MSGHFQTSARSEEPEAHLHPQMQEVFINQLNAAVAKLSAKYPTEPAVSDCSART
jgi:predicted ATP-dependent endonuclease of OLD family